MQDIKGLLREGLSVSYVWIKKVIFWILVPLWTLRKQ